jgi:hypothetical protein
MATNYDRDIERLSEETLGVLEATSRSADARLQELSGISAYGTEKRG